MTKIELPLKLNGRIVGRISITEDGEMSIESCNPSLEGYRLFSLLRFGLTESLSINYEKIPAEEKDPNS